MNGNRHFDPERNILPQNWTNSNATKYYNRGFWKRSPCEYGTKNLAKETADKWYPTATEESSWTNGCNPRSTYYDQPHNYYYSYNPNDCGDGGDCNSNKNCDCNKNNCEHNGYHNHGHGHGYGNNNCQNSNIHELKSYVYNNNCGDCKDVSIVYTIAKPDMDCDNIVELKIPAGGSKEAYLAKYFPPEFIEASRYQCATVTTYNRMPNNAVDNRQMELFTPSDQAALVRRGVKNMAYAKMLLDDGKIQHDLYGYNIPSSVAGNPSYYYMNNGSYNGNTNVGLPNQDTIKAYFD